VGLEERLFVQHDANFNVTSVVNTSGQVVERNVSNPYGQPTVIDADRTSDDNGVSNIGWVYMHQGGRYDATLKLSHFRYRDLHVSLGRWTRQDLLGYVDGENLTQALKSTPVFVPIQQECIWSSY